MAGDRRSRTRRPGTPTTRAAEASGSAEQAWRRRRRALRRAPNLCGSPPGPSRPAVPTPPYLPRARRSHSRPGTLSAAGTRPVQAAAAATASACTSRPRKRFPVPPPETDCASEGASARPRCAHAWLRFQESLLESVPRYPRLRSIAWCRSISFRDFISLDLFRSACLAEMESNPFLPSQHL